MKVSIPSNRGMCSNSMPKTKKDGLEKSQSPLIGACVPTNDNGDAEILYERSQSPLIGACVPTEGPQDVLQKAGIVSIPSNRGMCSNTELTPEAKEFMKSQSPLIGACVPTPCGVGYHPPMKPGLNPL